MDFPFSHNRYQGLFNVVENNPSSRPNFTLDYLLWKMKLPMVIEWMKKEREHEAKNFSRFIQNMLPQANIVVLQKLKLSDVSIVACKVEVDIRKMD
ncbi:hypothetical protein Lal_00040810 [Lupinus albus]|nr:hypothetical protein Lal_00040810 [Lupinus albus]